MFELEPLLPYGFELLEEEEPRLLYEGVELGEVLFQLFDELLLQLPTFFGPLLVDEPRLLYELPPRRA